MIPKENLAGLLKKEFGTTSKVLNAFPPGNDSFKPHDRSSSAIQLTSTFVFEMYLLEMYLFGDEVDRSMFKTYKPESVKAVAEDFEKHCTQVISRFEQLPESELSKTINFAGHSFAADDFVLMMLHDQIHHRGQLTVYIRMAGGQVPSVYGPSADDKSTNF